VALLATWPKAKPAELRPPFQGIARADAVTVAGLREFAKKGLFGSNETAAAALRKRATLAGEPASRALIEILDRYYGRTSADAWGWADGDERNEPEGVLIGELATEETARTLAGAVSDNDLHAGLRRALVVALSRKRFAFAADALVRVACDRRQDPHVREAILARFDRFGCPPPASLEELLYEPYRATDILTAAMLANCGIVEAPSLILDGLKLPWNDEQILRLCVDATRKITGKPIEYAHSYESIRALEEWIAAHPSRSAFETWRRTYLASERRQRELGMRTFADVTKAGDDFDLAAASLWLTVDSADWVEASLERLARLTHLCELRLSGIETPEKRIDVLNGLLAQLPDHEYREGHFSRLSGVLVDDFGDCLGRSTLYLAVADRLGLPLQAFSMPGHVYVTWVEGGAWRNIETTDEGRERPGDGQPASRRSVLSFHLSNRAAELLGRESYGDARRCADEAITLDPTNAPALYVRALATWQTDLDADPRPDIDRATEIFPAEAGYWLASSEIARQLGFAEDALRRADRAFRLDPSPDAAAMQARACLDLGHAERARKVVTEAAARWPDAAGALALLRFEMSLDNDDGPLSREDISPLVKARALLERGSPDRALRCLDAARESILAERKTRFEGNTIYAVDQSDRARGRREFHLLEAKALWKLDRRAAARVALQAAEEAAPPDRETLEVRTLLAGE
jgi:tetratricopeptide (TPR) repeat protein